MVGPTGPLLTLQRDELVDARDRKEARTPLQPSSCGKGAPWQPYKDGLGFALENRETVQQKYRSGLGNYRKRARLLN